jgi:hypothetical protein
MRFKYQDSVNINAFVQPSNFENVLFQAGKPLVQLIPLTEKNIKFKLHLESYEKFDYVNQKLSLYFNNRFQRLKKRRINDQTRRTEK